MKIIPKKLLKLNLLLAIIVFCLPFIMYAYLLIPEIKVVNFLFFSYELQNFENAHLFIFFLFGKFYIILFLSIWFLTIIDWWRYFIFPAIVLVSLQAYATLESVLGVDKNHVSIGVGIGVLYVIILQLLHRTLKIYRANTIHLLTFDIIKLISSYSSEKKLIILKQKLIDDQNSKNARENQNNRLNHKIKTLQSYLAHNGKLVYKYFAKSLDIKMEYLIVFLLLLAPFILKSYIFIPKIEDSVLRIGSFQYDTHFNSLYIFFYFFSIKFFHIFMLSIWFFTTKTILKYGIFFNIIIAIFQMFQVLNNKTSKLDENELWTALPIMIPILLTFLLLHRLIKYKNRNEVLNEEIEQEIQQVISELNSLDTLENKLVQELQLLRENKHALVKKDYLEQLKIIKAKLQTSNFN
ncbi:hypothetical protein [Cellulophaga baltica]|uniref:Uncharacterized protein n=1 Tax=Cellulophaga baltica TaxID=76594 RepID=A0A1G7G501_9FLAO|nr:hypothetical protein [Cellulophaga baltica]SDE83167.1 hypothetical protein SAMN04487992_104128 [Cellulophaga baltica]